MAQPTKKAKNAQRVLVTGGAGYIGSHTVLVLLDAGFDCVVIDNLDNSTEESIRRVKEELKSPSAGDVVFKKIDLCDFEALDGFLKSEEKFVACIHFAGLKAVGESVQKPLRYYENNLVGTLNLLKLLDKYDCHQIVFSSSATVYGDPGVHNKDPSKITEDYPLQGTNPYGRTKLFIEEIMRDLAISNPGKWKIVLLRYFNPIGAHPSGRLGEDPKGIPNNLCPYILQVAIGRREQLSVFGDDYKTTDGTGVRDYIHVMDLADGHLAALQQGLLAGKLDGDCEAFNLGTGTGMSVLQMVKAVEIASGKTIKYTVAARRPGDCAIVCADVSKVTSKWGWECTRSLQEACEDMWRWQSLNPKGFSSTL